MVTKATTSTATDTATTNTAATHTAATQTANPDAVGPANSEPRPSGIAPAGTTPDVVVPRAAAPSLAPPLPFRPSDFDEAFVLTKSDRDGVPKSAVGNHGPLDPGFVVRTAIATAIRLINHRERIATRFSEELSVVDRMDTFARSVARAEALLKATITPPEQVQAVYEKALEARRLLFSDLTNLVTHGLVDKEALGRVSNAAGHSNASRDIQTMAAIFVAGGEERLDKIATSHEKLTEYEQLSYQLVDLSARRSVGGPTTEEARDTFNRAMTLLVNCYSLAERIVAFFEWEDEAYRQIVPSLYGNRAKPRKSNQAEPTDPTTLPADEPATDVGIDAPAEPVVPGARGGSPFVTAKK